MSEGQGGRLISMADMLDEAANHLGSVLEDVRHIQEWHGKEYNGRSETGDSTRGMVSGVADDLENNMGQLRQAASDIRDHGERIIAAQGS